MHTRALTGEKFVFLNWSQIWKYFYRGVLSFRARDICLYARRRIIPSLQN
jgi:hypothetical protein